MITKLSIYLVYVEAWNTHRRKITFPYQISSSDSTSHEFALCHVLFRDVLWILAASDNIKSPYEGHLSAPCDPGDAIERARWKTRASPCTRGSVLTETSTWREMFLQLRPSPLRHEENGSSLENHPRPSRGVKILGDFALI